MNIFVLNTGRCGSTTFIKACQYISNYSASHESRARVHGKARLQYPDNHIEADNRLSWFLGRLDKQYADTAFYVHLTRNTSATADSFVKRQNFGIMKAYKEGILMLDNCQRETMSEDDSRISREIALDYIQTVNENIQHFLNNKTKTLEVHLETAKQDFQLFWHAIDAEGDMQAALKCWDTSFNAS